jgi:hypothetical protein
VLAAYGVDGEWDVCEKEFDSPLTSFNERQAREVSGGRPYVRYRTDRLRRERIMTLTHGGCCPKRIGIEESEQE